MNFLEVDSSACRGNWSVKVTYLPFLSVVGWTFVLTKSCISSTCEFIHIICSINCEIAPRIRSDAGTVWRGSGVGLACKLVFESAGRTTTIFDVLLANHCMMDDRVDRCSSEILHSA